MRAYCNLKDSPPVTYGSVSNLFVVNPDKLKSSQLLSQVFIKNTDT